MIIGLDTSVILRLLTGDPADQAQAVQHRLEQAHAHGDTVIVTDLVLAEAYFALVHHYDMDKKEARQRLKHMATSGMAQIEPENALAALEPSAGAGFVDRLIFQRYQSLNASTLTFDRALSALGAVRITAKR